MKALMNGHLKSKGFKLTLYMKVLLRTDDPAWKDFAMKPSLKFLLRGLAGLASSHPATQTALAATIISQLHLMEQMSSEEHLGSLAEAVLEALRSHPEAGARVEEVRTGTREEKKKMAMAMRAKQLKAIGLKTNDKGQVKAESSLLEQFQAIGEESGLACVICREGYRFQPTKVLAIYTFTRRAPLEEAERSVRKTIGFSTVSHFNLVHVDCHLAAVRQARARDEWESALLQNANTKCNGLLPLWGPGITESAYAACLARHNTYLAEATGQRDISYQATVHDIKLLLLKFAQERSFSVESGGGGPQSNMHLLPYLAHMVGTLEKHLYHHAMCNLFHIIGPLRDKHNTGGTQRGCCSAGLASSTGPTMGGTSGGKRRAFVQHYPVPTPPVASG